VPGITFCEEAWIYLTPVPASCCPQIALMNAEDQSAKICVIWGRPFCCPFRKVSGNPQKGCRPVMLDFLPYSIGYSMEISTGIQHSEDS
jgi:hypothetical protein